MQSGVMSLISLIYPVPQWISGGCKHHLWPRQEQINWAAKTLSLSLSSIGEHSIEERKMGALISDKKVCFAVVFYYFKPDSRYENTDTVHTHQEIVHSNLGSC